MESVIEAIFFLLTVISGLYALSLLPKKVDYKKVYESIKRNFLKVLTGVLLLYSLYLNILYSNSNKENAKLREEYYETRHLLDSNKTTIYLLNEKVDSLTREKKKL